MILGAARVLYVQDPVDETYLGQKDPQHGNIPGDQLVIAFHKVD